VRAGHIRTAVHNDSASAALGRQCDHVLDKQPPDAAPTGGRGHGEQPEFQFPVPVELTEVAAGPGGDHGAEKLAAVPVDGHPDLVLRGARRDIVGRVDLANLDSEKRYRGVNAYNNAKLAQILFTGEVDRRYR
jgi:hypothetical protein